MLPLLRFPITSNTSAFSVPPSVRIRVIPTTVPFYHPTHILLLLRLPYPAYTTNMSYYGASEPQTNMDAGKIFVGGLSWQTTEETLRYHFEQYGEVSSVEVMRDRNTGDPRGFAFVVFKSDETVELVMGSGPHEINNKIVDVKRAQARGVAPPSIHGADDPNVASQSHSRAKQENTEGLTPEQLKNKVFVGGLPLHVDKDGLKDFFSVFGPVTDAIVMMDMMAHRSRGFGFITFENGSNGAQKAIEAQPINMFGKMVEVKLATPKSDREGGGVGTNPNHQTFQKPVMAMSSRSTGEFAGLASAYGRAGWRAGYGSKAFGKAGWSVAGWDDGGSAPERSGFSFSMLPRSVLDSTDAAASGDAHQDIEDDRPAKRARQ